MNRVQRYKNSSRNKARYNAKSIARAKLFDTTRPGYRKTAAVRGFAPFTVRSRPEKKCFDCGDMPPQNIGDVKVVNFTSAGLVVPMFIPPLGSDYNQRNGRKVIVTSLYFKYRVKPLWIYVPTTAAFIINTQRPSIQARIALVYDTNPNGVLPLITDIFQVETGTTLVDVQSFINMNNRERFRILYDKFHEFGSFTCDVPSVGAINQNVNGSSLWSGKKYLKQKQEVVFNGTSNRAIADISSGAYYLVCLGTETALSQNYSVGDVNWRFRYDDN